MVFLAGPRQVGKTTFAKALLEKNHIPRERYLSWDAAEDREQIIPDVKAMQLSLEFNRGT